MPLRLVGRSSSHFTRVARVFAHELSVALDFEPVRDLLSQASSDYGENPALKLPVLCSDSGPWFGALPICRELARRAERPRRIVWPEQLGSRIASNAQELVLSGMSAEAGLIMRSVGATDTAIPYDDKTRESLRQTLAWLDAHLPDALATLDPARELSFLEVTACCFVTHLGFRQVLDASGYTRLQTFARTFGARPSLRATAYRFDA